MLTNLQPATPVQRHRFHLLDALRGIAALLIVVYHLPPSLSPLPLKTTYLAVDFFFCLSGFVIAFSYEKRLADSLSFKDFFVARMIRLYPVYLLGVSLGLIGLLTGIRHFFTPALGMHLLVLVLLQLAMLPNLHIWRSTYLFPLDSLAWSLFYELIANFAFAWLVRVRFASSRFLAVAALLCGASLVHWSLGGHTLDTGWGIRWFHIYLGLLRVIFSFSMGVLAFHLFRRAGRLKLTQAAQGTLAVAITLIFVSALLAPLAFLQTAKFQILTVTLLFPTCVYLGSLITTPSAWTGVCVFLGEISYPVYLLQNAFSNLLTRNHIYTFAMHHPRFAVGNLLCMVTITAYLAAKYYDAPLRKRLTRYYNKSSKLEA